MLDRVGTYNHSTVLLGEYQRIQSRMLDTQKQISTGKIGDSYADIDGKSGVLAAAKAQAARTASLSETAKEASSRVSLQDTQLQHLSELSDQFRDSVGNALATGRGDSLMDTLRGLYSSVVSVLNTRVDGVYIYGGTRSDVPPVSAGTLDQMIAAPSVASVFQNSPLAQSQTVAEGVSLETGLIASDLASGLFQAMRSLASVNAGAPFGSRLTQAETTALSAAAATAPQVSRDLNTIMAGNGAVYAQVQDAITRHEDMTVELKKLIGDLEDADLPAAITRLNQDQAAQQAAAQMISRLNEISLLNYLR